MDTDVEIAALDRAQQGAAIEVLAAAFDADPVYGRLLPDARRRRTALRALFRLAVADARRVGAVDAAAVDGRLAGVAVWLAPGRFPLSAPRKLRSLPGMVRLLRAEPRSFSGLAGLGARIEAAHPPAPSWYLQVIGVQPAAQGRGVGGRLLAHGLARADREQAATTLETAVPAAAALYERLGFVTHDRRRLVDGADAHRFMHRPAVPAATAAGRHD